MDDQLDQQPQPDQEQPKPQPDHPDLDDQPKQPPLTQLQAIVELARRGNRKILPKLRQVLDENPEIWKTHGDLASKTLDAWIDLLGGDDLFAKGCVGKMVDEMRQEISGPDPDPLEKLLIGRILACFVQTNYYDLSTAAQTATKTPELEEFLIRRQDRAQRRFVQAVGALVTIRKLLPRAIDVTVRESEIKPQPADQTQPTAAQDQPVAVTNRLKGQPAPLQNQTIDLMPKNGKLNGHSYGRLSSVLEMP